MKAICCAFGTWAAGVGRMLPTAACAGRLRAIRRDRRTIAHAAMGTDRFDCMHTNP